MTGVLQAIRTSFCSLRALPNGPFRNLKVALIADELTRSCLALECQVRDLTPINYKFFLKFWKPDVLFVESAWQGLGNAWKYKIASYQDHPKRNNNSLRSVVSYARDLGIPCVFWNKEDGVHFDRFISSASLFDYIFTVDENCISRYRAAVGPHVAVAPLMFAAQPVIHSPSPNGYVHQRACFVGSFSWHVHDRRRKWQEILFAASSDVGLTVFDRNSGRRSSYYRYPDLPWLEVRPSVHHTRTPQIYRDYMISLNVNTVEDSGTMFSRRLIEILACAGLAVTTPALSVSRYFKDYCHTVSSLKEAQELFGRLRNGLSANDRQMIAAGAEYILKRHTWTHRLEEIMTVISGGHASMTMANSMVGGVKN
jgi:spore maturation protein CgeB